MRYMMFIKHQENFTMEDVPQSLFGIVSNGLFFEHSGLTI